MRTNQIVGLEVFLKEWDSPTSSFFPAPQSSRGPLNNINIDGSLEGPAIIATRHHPSFSGFLEAQVRDLVICLIQELDCVTYSSCSGHAGPDGVLLCARHVSILPRDPLEYERLKDRLRISLLGLKVETKSLAVELDEGVLDSGDAKLPCLEILFRPLTNRAADYFKEADDVCSRLVSKIAAAHAK
jgi:hypothetical protein